MTDRVYREGARWIKSITRGLIDNKLFFRQISYYIDVERHAPSPDVIYSYKPFEEFISRLIEALDVSVVYLSDMNLSLTSVLIKYDKLERAVDLSLEVFVRGVELLEEANISTQSTLQMQRYLLELQHTLRSRHDLIDSLVSYSHRDIFYTLYNTATNIACTSSPIEYSNSCIETFCKIAGIFLGADEPFSKEEIERYREEICVALSDIGKYQTKYIEEVQRAFDSIVYPEEINF